MSDDIKPGDWAIRKGRELLHCISSRMGGIETLCGIRSRIDSFRIPPNADEYFLCKRCKVITGDDRLTQDHTPEEAEAYYEKYPEKLIYPGKKTA